MNTGYNRIELGVGVAGLAGAGMCAGLNVAPVHVAIPDLFKWAGLVLLVQGLARDVVLLTVYRVRRPADGDGTPAGLWLCLESTLGAGLVGLYVLLLLLGTQGAVTLPAAGAAGLVSLVWLFGYGTRDVIVEARRDPNHLQLLVGLRSKPGKTL